MRNPMRLVLAAALLPGTLAAQPITDRAAIIERMGEADLNRDGVVTRAELITWRTANFTRFDRNQDGVLSDADIPGFVRMTPMAGQFEMLKAQFDVNRDGKVTRDEFVNRPTTLFDLADANHDNQLTKAEIDAAMQAQRAAR